MSLFRCFFNFFVQSHQNSLIYLYLSGICIFMRLFKLGCRKNFDNLEGERGKRKRKRKGEKEIKIK